MYVQEIILNLSNFWLSKGCTYISSTDDKKGAATFNSNAIFLLLKKKYVKLMFLERVVRPNDGIGIINSTRSFNHHQFEVLVKDNSDLMLDNYFQSLEYIGINKDKFAIESIEDNWCHETLNAIGFGWEIRCNGLEITQCTYFKQLCGISFELFPYEIAYGIERIAMILQNVSSVFDLQWSEDISYKDLFWNAEKENHFSISIYNEKEVYDLFEKFQYCIDKQLYERAFSFILQVSHIFNSLCANGNISIDLQKKIKANIKKKVTYLFDLLSKEGWLSG